MRIAGTVTPTYLRVPPLQRLEPSPQNDELAERIKILDSQNRNFVSCFGLELEAATLLARDGSDDHRMLLQRFIGRPATEPLMLHLWQNLRKDRLDEDDIVRIGSSLAGRQVRIAQGTMRTRPNSDGKYTVYPDLEYRGLWSSLLAPSTDHARQTVNLALFAYLVVILCHPLSDGNGRLARALATAALARSGCIAAPILPLGPAFYSHRRIVVETVAELSETGDWNAAVCSLRVILNTACDMAMEVRRLA